MAVFQPTETSLKFSKLANQAMEEEPGEEARNVVRRLAKMMIPDPENPMSYVSPLALTRMEAAKEVVKQLPRLSRAKGFKFLRKMGLETSANEEGVGAQVIKEEMEKALGRREDVKGLVSTIFKSPKKLLDQVQHIQLNFDPGRTGKWTGWYFPTQPGLAKANIALKEIAPSIGMHTAKGVFGHELAGHGIEDKLLTKKGYVDPDVYDKMPMQMEALAEWLGSQITGEMPKMGYGIRQGNILDKITPRTKNPYFTALRYLEKWLAEYPGPLERY